MERLTPSASASALFPLINVLFAIIMWYLVLLYHFRCFSLKPFLMEIGVEISRKAFEEVVCLVVHVDEIIVIVHERIHMVAILIHNHHICLKSQLEVSASGGSESDGRGDRHKFVSRSSPRMLTACSRSCNVASIICFVFLSLVPPEDFTPVGGLDFLITFVVRNF